MSIKSHPSKNKVTHNSYGHATPSVNQHQVVGSLVPPNYGIDFVDAGRTDTVPAQLKSQVENSTVIQARTGSEDSKPVPKSTNNPNLTGLPDRLKTGIEHLSGYSMDSVRVHYNSSKPAQLQAHAYTQGTDIHVAPGQEKHLPHEAWHVVQQMQGRVKPTIQMKRGVNINDDVGLEREADVMGEMASVQNVSGSYKSNFTVPISSADIIQRVVTSSAMTERDNHRGKWRLEWEADETNSVTVRFEHLPRIGHNEYDYENVLQLPNHDSIATLDGVEWQGKEAKLYTTEQNTNALRRYSIEVQQDSTATVRRELTISADTPDNIRAQNQQSQRIYGSTANGGQSVVYRALSTAFDRCRQALTLAVEKTDRNNIPRNGVLRQVMNTHFRGAGANQLAHIRGVFNNIKVGLEGNEEHINDYYQGIRAGGAEGEAYLTQQQRNNWTQNHPQGVNETVQEYQMRMLADIGAQSTVRLDYMQLLMRQKDYVVRAIIHELAHKYGHVADYAYANDANAYEGMNAGQAINNADSYAFAAVSFLQKRLVGHDRLNQAGHFVTEELGALILGNH